MEALETDIQKFLAVSDGDGSGYGYGYGDGYGSGAGYGYGSGDGIKSLNGHKVYMIDSTPTLIYHVRGQIAVGAILQDDLTLRDCYIAKMGNFFAHGETAEQAIADAQKKYEKKRPLKERIASFVAKFPIGVKAPASEFFEWHNILTGSCTIGREQFCRERGIKMDDLYTSEQFIDITKDAYGSDAILKLKEAYEK